MAAIRTQRRARNHCSPRVIVARRASELSDHIGAWEALASAAVEPNVFLESWMLVPAVRAFAGTQDLRFVFVYGAAGDDRLYGVFPFERVRYKQTRLIALRPWRHLYGFLQTPLVRADAAELCLDALFRWLHSEASGIDLIEIDQLDTDGAFFAHLVNHLNRAGHSFQVGDGFTRAFFRPRADAQAYLSEALPGDHRKTLRRRERRLAEIGRITYRMLEPGDDLEPWLAAFLQTEAGGWKGQAGTSLASKAVDRQFFETIAREAHRRGRLGFLAMHLDGRPIAWQCTFRAGDGAFAFKTAYDEAYARFSPGILLQLELIRRLHQPGAPEWLDSCADADSYLNDLWIDRRTIQTVRIGIGTAGEFVGAALPLLRWIKRCARSFVRRDSGMESRGP